MLVIILPFLLAAHVMVQDDEGHSVSDWQQYGPEWNYDVLVNMSLANVIQDKDNFCSMVAFDLKCRPRGSDTLGCRFVNGRIVRPDPQSDRCTNGKHFVPVSDKFVNEDPFEIRFNAKGIENLVVSRDIPRWRLDMIRAIVGQLNVGFELENGRDGFVTMEKNRDGYCEVEVKMLRLGDRKGNDRSNEKKFEIVFEPERADFVPLSRAAVRIEKIRQPKKCPYGKNYFFGNHEDFSLGDKGTFMDTTSSVSHVYISQREMHSYTESTGIMRNMNRARTMRIYQKISLSLKSVNPARSSLPEIINPASTSLYAYTNLERIAEK